ncbi:hypothetical protein JIR001_14220 [Polycladomyces abyssicola]|uniref:Resolvase/invertase-type recombinase catalytic domain-containing protein n=1 Tax=Polycladomyces abyssicola TaxID=1125966 RepID=A0A8D5UG43_9BACL|nr:hypothetical protein JIR001_14220 [Polycladomyces abyssicola]
MSRSITDVVCTYELFQDWEIHLVSLCHGIDTRLSNDIMTKAMVTILGLFAEMERTFIAERTMAGKMTAKDKMIDF